MKQNDPSRSITFSDLTALKDDMQRGFADVVTQILENMVTKNEFEARMSQMVTKSEFESFREETNVRFERIEQNMVAKSDISDMVGELQSVRQQLILVMHQYERIRVDVDRINSHLALV